MLQKRLGNCLKTTCGDFFNKRFKKIMKTIFLSGENCDENCLKNCRNCLKEMVATVF